MPKGYGRSGMASKYKEQIIGHEVSEEDVENAKQKDIEHEQQRAEDLEKIQNLKNVPTREVTLNVKRRHKRKGQGLFIAVEIIIILILAVLAGCTLYSIYDPQFGIDHLENIKRMQQTLTAFVVI